MATYEKRRNVEGQITSIRVKIRRVGLPHLSQTFPVSGNSQTALRQAEKAAKAWVAEVTKGLGIQHGNIKSSFNTSSHFNQMSMAKANSSKQPQVQTELPFNRIFSKTEGDQLINDTHDSQTKILLALLLECGMTLEEISRSRWQHFHFSQRKIEVIGSSGFTQRYVPLTPTTIEALLASHQRKYGLLFTESPSQLFDYLSIKELPNFPAKSNTPIEQLLRLEAAHRMADNGANEDNICEYLGVSRLDVLANTNVRPNPFEKSFY